MAKNNNAMIEEKQFAEEIAIIQSTGSLAKRSSPQEEYKTAKKSRLIAAVGLLAVIFSAEVFFIGSIIKSISQDDLVLRLQREHEIRTKSSCQIWHHDK